MLKSCLLRAGVIGLALFISACSKSPDAPALVSPDASAKPDESAPSADQTIAKEAGQKKIVYHVGPIDLPAKTDLKVMLDKPLSMRFQTDEAVWAIGFIPKVVDSNGTELPKELLHESIISNAHDENPLCTGSPNPFFITSSVLTEIRLPQGFGYPILPTDPLEAKVVLSNPTEKNYVNVFFELTLVAKPMNDFSAISDVKPILLELEPCKHSPMDVEPNKFVERKATYQIPVDSNLILANGVIGNFGSAISLFSGKEIMPFWRTEAIVDNNRSLEGMTANPFEDSNGISFKSGDQITFSAAYDNQSDIWLPGARAAAMIYIAPK